MLLVVQLIVLSSVAVYGERETHRLIKTYDGADIAQDIVYDKEDNTVAITVSQSPALEYLIPTVNYHDFNTNCVAFKDIERGVCLLTNPPIPFATPNVYKLKRTNVTLAFRSTFRERLLNDEEVLTKYGDKIGNFCKDYKTYWMDLTPKLDNEPIKREADEPEPCVAACGWCIVDLDTDYKNAANVNVLG